MWRALLSLSVALAPGCSAPVAAPRPADGELIAFGGGPGGPDDACFTCHGLKGEGDRLAPRLAGQSAGYLLKQMEDYAARWRDHPQMTAVAARLGDGDRMAVAHYYANLELQSGPLRPAIGGWSLFLEGDAERGLAPCARCHGPRGQGKGLANPRLAGQPAEYVDAQLQAFKASTRRNDPQDQMGAIARKLTPAEIDALASYVGGLP
jgi:cytochrome c553